MFRIMIILHSRRAPARVTRQQFAEILGCSDKTIQRDINQLKDAEVPIEYRTDSRSYELTDKNWTFPAVNLTPTDVLALGLIQAWIANGNGAFPYTSQISEALRKTTSSLTAELKKSFNSVGEYLAEVGGTARKYSDAPIGLLLQASMENRTVELLYESRSSRPGVYRPRRLDPYRLDRRSGQFFELQAFCHENQTMRTFAPDRMKNLVLTDEVFRRRDLVLEDKGAVGGLRSTEKVEVVVRFDKTVADYAKEHGWTIAPTFEDDISHSGSVIMRGVAQGTASLVKELLRWGRHVEVLGSAKLRDDMVAEIKAMEKIYGD